MPAIQGRCEVYPADDLLASDIAVAAGQRLVEIRASGLSADDLRHAGDAGSQAFLAAELARARPGDAVLSEEAADDPARLSAERVWIIDPLDGTREFGEPGRVDWAVHVALWERGELTAGAVALPAQGVVLSTAEPPNGRKPPAAEAERPPGPALRGVPGHRGLGGVPRSAEWPPRSALRLVVSRSRPPEFVQRLAGRLGAELVPLGSAGAKAAAVITGEVDAYVHSGGQYEWDSAAPVAVARSAGLHASRIDGSSLRYNREKPWVPDILICPSPLAGRMLDAISAVSASD